jgi:hypothetical protein
VVRVGHKANRPAGLEWCQFQQAKAQGGGRPPKRRGGETSRERVAAQRVGRRERAEWGNEAQFGSGLTRRTGAKM